MSESGFGFESVSVTEIALGRTYREGRKEDDGLKPSTLASAFVITFGRFSISGAWG